jgi:hypothetical protein
MRKTIVLCFIHGFKVSGHVLDMGVELRHHAAIPSAYG